MSAKGTSSLGNLRRIPSSSLTRLVVSSETGIFLGFSGWAAGSDGNWESKRMCGVSLASSVRSCTAEGLGGTKPPTIPKCESDNIREIQMRPYRVECVERMAQATSVLRYRQKEKPKAVWF